jgi:hypothetical protein
MIAYFSMEIRGDDVVELLSEESTDLARLVVKEQRRERTSSVNVSLTSSS